MNSSFSRNTVYNRIILPCLLLPVALASAAGLVAASREKLFAGGARELIRDGGFASCIWISLDEALLAEGLYFYALEYGQGQEKKRLVRQMLVLH